MSPDHVTPGPETVPGVAAPVRAATPGTPAATPATLPARVLQLQRQAGNAAVTSLLAGMRPAQRRGASDDRAPGGASGPVPTVQRNVPPDKSVALPDNYDTMTDREKTAVIRDLLAANPGMVYTAWKGLKGPLAVAQANPDLFTASMKIDDDIVDLSAFDGMRETFKKDVLGKATGYLTSNKRYVQEERDRTGAQKAGDTVGGQVQARVDMLSGKGASAETDFAVQDVQKAAEQMEGIKKRKATCLSTPVGYSVRMVKGAGGEYFETHTKQAFSPGEPPRDWRPARRRTTRSWPSGPS